MCGIAGISLNPRATFDPIPLSKQLLRAIESRGRDASGAAWTDDEGTWFDKAPSKGSVYADRMPMSPLAHTVILHTRMATNGSPKDNVNNHPHSVPGVVGVHNGVIWNDYELFAFVGAEPQGQCDSEAIFALLAGRDTYSVTDVLSLIEGDASLAWIETDTPDRLHLARLEGRPLAMARTPKGSIVFASTVSLLKAAADKAHVQLARVWDLPEWTYIVVERGRVIAVESFAPARPKARVRKYVGSRSVITPSYPDWHGDEDYWNAPDPRDIVPQGLGLGKVRS